MKTLGNRILPLLFVTLMAGAVEPPPTQQMPPMAKPFASPALEQWRTAVKAPSYATAGAHAPDFPNAVLWPKICDEDGTPAYKKQAWPKARLLVWNRFEGDEKAARSIDHDDPGNWLEDGKAATDLPDEDSDVVFPNRDQPYRFHTGHGSRQEKAWQSRHLTVGRNANVYTMGWSVHGNLWIKDGASPYFRHGGEFKGAKTHCFARCDIAPAWRPGLGRRPAEWDAKDAPFTYQFTQYLHVMKPGGSMEIVANLSTQDQFHVDAGVFIVGPDSYFGYGYRGNLHLPKEGTIQLQSGSAMSRLENIHERIDADLKGGKLLAGSPERPLHRDAVFGLSAKDILFETGDGYAGRIGMNVRNGSRIEVNPAKDAKGAKARLRIEWMGADFKECQRQHRHIIASGLHRDLDGVTFDDVLLGGFAVGDDPTAVLATWKDVVFGARCGSTRPDELITRHGNPGQCLISPQHPLLDPKGVTVTLRGALRSGFEIRYTLDGSDPTSSSVKYEKPLIINKPTLLRALVFVDGKPIRTEPFNGCPKEDYLDAIVSLQFTDAKPLPAARPGEHKPGLALAQSPNVPWRAGMAATLAAAAKLKPERTASTPEDVRLSHEYLAVFSGFVQVDQDGVYGFTLDTSGVGLIEVAGLRIADWRHRGSTGRIALAKGLHPIRIVANHQHSGGNRTWLQLFWNGPGVSGTEQVPAARLFH